MNAFKYFYDIPSLFIILVGIAAAIVLTRSFKIFIMGVNSLLSKKYQILEENKSQAIHLFRYLAKFNLAFSVLVVLITFVLIAQEYTEMHIFLLHMCVNVLTVIYALIINIIFLYPAAYILENRRIGIKN